MAVKIDPVTYVMEAMRAIVLEIWEWGTIFTGVSVAGVMLAVLLRLHLDVPPPDGLSRLASTPVFAVGFSTHPSLGPEDADVYPLGGSPSWALLGSSARSYLRCGAGVLTPINTGTTELPVMDL